MYLLLKIVVDDLDKQRRTFFWQGGSEKEIPVDAKCALSANHTASRKA
jgi:hypothetical protein